jgi:large subunit ribosomal protein L24
MLKIRQGDTVEIISGDYVGDRGTVRDVQRPWKVSRARQRLGRDPNRARVVISGVNIIIKHQRRMGQTRTQTGRIELEAPIHISNVMLVCPRCGERTRVRFRVYEDGTKSRACARCDQVID